MAKYFDNQQHGDYLYTMNDAADFLLVRLLDILGIILATCRTILLFYIS